MGGGAAALLQLRAIYTQIRGGRKSKKRGATDNVLIIIRFGDSYNDMNLLQKIIANSNIVTFSDTFCKRVGNAHHVAFATKRLLDNKTGA